MYIYLFKNRILESNQHFFFRRNVNIVPNTLYIMSNRITRNHPRLCRRERLITNDRGNKRNDRPVERSRAVIYYCVAFAVLCSSRRSSDLYRQYNKGSDADDFRDCTFFFSCDFFLRAAQELIIHFIFHIVL